MTFNVNKTSNILKEIITIIMALAFTNTIIVFLTSKNGGPKTKQDFDLISILSFIVLITSIIRFFHGNHSYLQKTYDVNDFKAFAGKFNIRLTIDFVFIFLQGIIFCALSVYQSATNEFYSLFTVLFYIDSIWFFVIWCYIQDLKLNPNFDENEKDSKTQTHWMVTNFVTASIMLVLIIPRDKFSLTRILILSVVIIINMIFDYFLNWNTYFPAGITKGKDMSIFVAARFTSAIKEDIFNEDLKAQIDTVHEVVKSLDFKLFSAHKNEKFGNALEDPDIFVKRDLKEISEASLLIAILDKEISSGVCIELGWASLISKPIILVIPDGYDMNNIPMIKSLYNLCHCEVLKFNNLDQLEEKLKDVLKNLTISSAKVNYNLRWRQI